MKNLFNRNILFQNSIFHPYLSLQQMELLKSPQVRSFLVGASNYLYRRQKGLSDVLVDVSTNNYFHVPLGFFVLEEKYIKVSKLFSGSNISETFTR